MRTYKFVKVNPFKIRPFDITQKYYKYYTHINYKNINKIYKWKLFRNFTFHNYGCINEDHYIWHSITIVLLIFTYSAHSLNSKAR
jgi:hypothetical protein